MTGRNLPPDTGHELSTLKRRVSDLERALDRIRRHAATPAPPGYIPFALIASNGSTTGTANGADPLLVDYEANGSKVTDPTGQVLISAPWEFTFVTSGWWELGATIRFDPAAGGTYRSMGFDQFGDPYIEPRFCQTVANIPGTDPVLSGSRMIHMSPAAGPARWRVWAGQDSGTDLGFECVAYWTRLVMVPKPVPGIEDDPDV